MVAGRSQRPIATSPAHQSDTNYDCCLPYCHVSSARQTTEPVLKYRFAQTYARSVSHSNASSGTHCKCAWACAGQKRSSVRAWTHLRAHTDKYQRTHAHTSTQVHTHTCKHTHTHARASCANAFASALSPACTTQPAHFHFNPASRHSAALTPASANAHHNHTTRSLATAPTRTTPRPRFSNLLPHKHAHLGAKIPGDFFKNVRIHLQ